MATLLQDIRFGLRTLRKSPGFTVVAVLTTAVGIAANTTVFNWIEGVLLNPLPATGDPGRLTVLETVAPSGEHLTTSYPDYRDLRDGNRLFDGITVNQPRPLNIGEGVGAERIWGELVSGNFFDVLQVKPAQGRFFMGAERDDNPGGHLVAVISHRYWKTHFHADPSAVGSTMRINRYPFTIIGVAPEKFGGAMSALAFDVWVPAMSFGELIASGDFLLRDRKCRMFLSVARLKAGVTMPQAREELKSLSRRLAESYAATNQGISTTVMPMWQASFGSQKTMLAPLSILMAVCGVVLLIACANLANLLLTRATSRAKEFSVRLALGAPRGRLIRQVLVETLMLALAGAALGLILFDQMRNSIRWLLPATSTPTIVDSGINWRVLLFTEVLALAVTVGAGLMPALHAARMHVNEVLKEGGRGGSEGRRAHGLRGALVMAEVALAAVALVGAGLFMKSFQLARTIYPGFDARHVAVAELDLSTAGYEADQATLFCRRLRQQLENSPGVEAVSFADSIPLGFMGAAWEDLQIQGYVPGTSENMKIYRNLVAPGYFSLLGISMVEGRDFTDHDDEKSLPVMIVNQAFVRRFLPRQNPIGQKVKGWGRWFTIVGVVKDGKYLSFTESPQPYFYIPIRQVYRPEYGLKFYVRMAGPPEPAVATVRQAVASIDPNVAMFDGVALGEYIAGALFGQKVAATLLSGLGTIALLLAAVGLYSVMAYSIVQRTHEIGIRIALGATPVNVTWLALKRGIVLTGVGLTIGLAGSIALARLAAAALAGVSPADPQVYVGVALFLGAVAMSAIIIPARRAAQVDPIVSLRVE